MTDPTRDLLPEGLEDRLPREAAAVTRISRAVIDVMDSHGYDRVRPPLIEFEKSMAGRMDGVQPRRMFRFVDPTSLRTLAVRSDITVQVGRIAATSLAAAPRPLRLCYGGPVVTIKGDGLDPSRERLQLGAELIGSDSVAAVSEIVLLAIEALTAAGAQGISVDFTLPNLVDTLAAGPFPLPAGAIETVRRELDAKDAGSLREAGGEDYLPLLYATGPFAQAIEQLSAIDAGGALVSRIEGLKAVAASVGDKARITLDPTERHGFAYQSWFGFQIFVPGQGDAIGRGGGYSIPVGEDREESAVGFSLYPDPLIDDGLGVEDDRERRILLPVGHDAAMGASLRADGWRTIVALADGDEPAPLGCGFILGPDGPQAVGD